MAIIGILLISIGFVILNYIITGLGGPAHNRPLIFYSSIARNIIILFCIVFLIGGLICLWKVSPFVACLPVAGCAFLLLSGFMLSNDGARAKLFFNIYKTTKTNNDCSDEEALKEATKIYLRRHGKLVTVDRINKILRSIFDPTRTEELLTTTGMVREIIDDAIAKHKERLYDPQNVANAVLFWEDSLMGQVSTKDPFSLGRSDEIAKAYKRVIGGK